MELCVNQLNEQFILDKNMIKKFTLIELLVVIAIIGILASLLMPSLHKAREKVRITVCLNNLKNIRYTTHIYTDENNGRFYSEWNGWDGERYFDNGEFAIEYYGSYQVLYDHLYLNSKQSFMCPSFNIENEAQKFSFSYGKSHDLQEITINTIENLNEQMFSTDTKYEWLQANKPPRVHVRHLQSLNHLWLDGHVTNLKYTSFYNNLQWIYVNDNAQRSWSGEFTIEVFEIAL